jgi:hypothetical protein
MTTLILTSTFLRFTDKLIIQSVKIARFSSFYVNFARADCLSFVLVTFCMAEISFSDRRFHNESEATTSVSSGSTVSITTCGSLVTPI